jgi:hypothetical protein
MPKIKESASHINAHISLDFTPKEQSFCHRIKITVRDREDRWNLPVAFTTKTRRVEEAWVELNLLFTEDTTWSDVIHTFNKHDVEYHQFCSMD